MIDLLPDADQQRLVDAIAQFAREQLPVARLRDGASGAPELRDWHRMAELGWLGLGLDEEIGGAGQGIAEELLLQREAGRHLLSPSFLASCLAAHVARACDDHGLARAIVSGEERVAQGAFHGGLPDDGRLDGTVSVLDGEGAGWTLVWDCAGLGLYEMARLGSLQQCRPWHALVTVQQAQCTGVTPTHWIAAGPELLVERTLLLSAAQAAGMAEASRDMAAGYARERQQFGKPIGTFQAVAHQCADMAVRAHAAWTQCAMAAVALQAGRPEAPWQATAAWMISADAAERNALSNIQVHGGIGYTAECEAQFFLKRSLLLGQLAPPAAAIRKRALMRHSSGSEQA